MNLFNSMLRIIIYLIFETLEKENRNKKKTFLIRAGFPVGIYLPKSEKLCRGESI